MAEVTNFPYGIWAPNLGVPNWNCQAGQAFYVDGVNGNDGFDGQSPQSALFTLEKAYTYCVAGRGDVVYIFNNGAASGTIRLAAPFTWGKANTHLIGICAPVGISQRARISHATTATTFTPMFTVDAAGCVIANIQFFQGYATSEAQINFVMSTNAQRCYIYNCHIAGFGSTLGAAHTGSQCLQLVGAENLFERCTIGIDTETQGANNTVVIAGTGSTGAARNVFKDCLFLAYTNSASKLFVSAAASTFDRWIMFQRCTFINAIQSGSTTMSAVMSINGTGSPAGMVIIDKSNTYGSTYWVASDTAKVMLIGDPGAANSQLIGIGLTADHA